MFCKYVSTLLVDRALAHRSKTTYLHISGPLTHRQGRPGFPRLHAGLAVRADGSGRDQRARTRRSGLTPCAHMGAAILASRSRSRERGSHCACAAFCACAQRAAPGN